MNVTTGKQSNDTNIILVKEGETTKYDNYFSEYKFKAEKGQILHVRLPSGRKLIAAGLGKTISSNTVKNAVAVSIKAANQLGSKEASIKTEHAEDAAYAATLATYKYEQKTEEKEPQLHTVIIEEKNPEQIKTGKIIAEETVNARQTINQTLTPEEVADYISKQAKKHSLKCKIMDEKEMAKNKMNAILAVGKGSTNTPRLAILIYKGNPESNKKIVLVGKGVCFDSGGLGIKPGEGMETMRDDKSGALVVVHTLIAAARLGIKQNIIAITPLVENMPGGSAYKPGEIIKTMSGKTIEIKHTDAEGRVILSDAIHYATLYKPEAIIDIATLTGACITALGDEIAGIMGNNSKLAKKIFDAGEKTGERVWELPMYEEYDELVKGDFADYKNLSKSEGHNPAGAIQGAKFLEKFIGEIPWCHIDIGGPSWCEHETGTHSKGATAYGVNLLTQMLIEW